LIAVTPFSALPPAQACAQAAKRGCFPQIKNPKAMTHAVKIRPFSSLERCRKSCALQLKAHFRRTESSRTLILLLPRHGHLQPNPPYSQISQAPGYTFTDYLYVPEYQKECFLLISRYDTISNFIKMENRFPTCYSSNNINSGPVTFFNIYLCSCVLKIPMETAAGCDP